MASAEQLTGLGAAVLEEQLGKPDFTRREAPAEIWQYRNESCVLDVFLYPEAGELRVAHVETRVRRADPGDDRDCLPFAIAAS